MANQSLKARLEQNPPARITVIRTDRVGDLILSTPFLAGLRQGFPQAEITAVVEPYCREVLRESDLVDRVVTKLPTQDCDLAIALAPRTESWKLAYKTKAPIRLGYAYTDRPLARMASKWLLTERELVTIRPPLQVPHEVVQLDLLARRLGLSSTQTRPLSIGLKGEHSSRRLVFHLGDRWLVGDWRFEDLRIMLRALRAYGEVYVTAGPREAELVANNGLDVDGVHLRFGTSFRDWAELIGSACAVVSPDTGAVHLAAAMGTPVVVAYEAATYEHCSRQWAPWMVESRSVVKGSPSRTLSELLIALEELVSERGKRFVQAGPGDFEERVGSEPDSRLER